MGKSRIGRIRCYSFLHIINDWDIISKSNKKKENVTDGDDDTLADPLWFRFRVSAFMWELFNLFNESMNSFNQISFQRHSNSPLNEQRANSKPTRRYFSITQLRVLFNCFSREDVYISVNPTSPFNLNPSNCELLLPVNWPVFSGIV